MIERRTSTSIFVNLPVADLRASMSFFKELGFVFDPRFTDQNAACMIIADNIRAMLISEGMFKSFTPKPVADAKASTEVLLAISLESRAAVDEMVRKAVAAGGEAFPEAKDHGFMYYHGFSDLDGHIWEPLWMDPAAAKG